MTIATQQLNYWNAGSPNYRWQQIAMANSGLTSFPGFRALALLNVAIADAEAVARTRSIITIGP